MTKQSITVWLNVYIWQVVLLSISFIVGFQSIHTPDCKVFILEVKKVKFFSTYNKEEKYGHHFVVCMHTRSIFVASLFNIRRQIKL